MSKHLRQVTAARRRWHQACADGKAAYIEAVRSAREAGHTMPEIGTAAGTSKQAVLYLLRPDPRKEQKT